MTTSVVISVFYPSTREPLVKHVFKYVGPAIVNEHSAAGRGFAPGENVRHPDAPFGMVPGLAEAGEADRGFDN